MPVDRLIRAVRCLRARSQAVGGLLSPKVRDDLAAAVVFLDPKVVHRLTERSRHNWLDARDEFGRTALMLAMICRREPAFIRALLDAGANARDRDDAGMTALMWGAYARANPESLQMVIDRGDWYRSIDPFMLGRASFAVATDLRGRDALDYALRAKPSSAQLLIDEYLYCRSHTSEPTVPTGNKARLARVQGFEDGQDTEGGFLAAGAAAELVELFGLQQYHLAVKAPDVMLRLEKVVSETHRSVQDDGSRWGTRERRVRLERLVRRGRTLSQILTAGYAASKVSGSDGIGIVRDRHPSATTTGMACLLVECGADVSGPVQDEEAFVDSRATRSLGGFDGWYDRDSVAALVAVGADPNALDALGRLPLIEALRSHVAARAEAPLASADSDGVHVAGEEVVRELRARLAVAAGGLDEAAGDHDLRELRTRLA